MCLLVETYAYLPACSRGHMRAATDALRIHCQVLRMRGSSMSPLSSIATHYFSLAVTGKLHPEGLVK